jgi:glutathione synthase
MGEQKSPQLRMPKLVFKRQKKFKRTLLWITDPWPTLDHPRDTTLRFMEEAWKLGIPQAWCDVKSIRLETHQVLLNASRIRHIEPGRGSAGFEFQESRAISLKQFEEQATDLHYRTDPPVDQAYLYPLLLLNLGLKASRGSKVVNPLSVLLSLNEKMEASTLKGLMPPSLVSSQWEPLQEFGKSVGRTVLKPLNEAQSHGIELLDWRTAEGRDDAKTRLMQATQNFSVPVITQRFLEGSSEGETRLWFLDGKLLAYVKKLPVQGDFRVNLDRGSALAPTELSRKEKAISSQISKHLKQLEIRMAAVDLIEGYVTDFNFTSPGLIPQMETLLGENLALSVVKVLAA